MCTKAWSVLQQSNLLYHDAVDAHVLVTPGEVEQVDPAESQRHHQEAQILVLPTQVQDSGDQEEEGLQETNTAEQSVWLPPATRQENDKLLHRDTYLTSASQMWT